MNLTCNWLCGYFLGTGRTCGLTCALFAAFFAAAAALGLALGGAAVLGLTIGLAPRRAEPDDLDRSERADRSLLVDLSERADGDGLTTAGRDSGGGGEVSIGLRGRPRSTRSMVGGEGAVPPRTWEDIMAGARQGSSGMSGIG